MYKHGYSKDKDYFLCHRIIDRCYNKNAQMYDIYGGRGIKVCDDWLKDPLKFVEYIKSLENYREKNYSIDRINNNGNYEPNNIRWTTKSVQSANQRKKKSNTTGYTGINLNKCGNYFACLTFNKEYKYLGTYKTINEALSARNDFIIQNNLEQIGFKIQKLIN